jgi:hypothetical protein
MGNAGIRMEALAFSLSHRFLKTLHAYVNLMSGRSAVTRLYPERIVVP